MLGDAFDDMPQISLRIKPVQFGRTDKAVDCGGSLAAGVGACEEIVFSPRATARNARSAALLSISIVPSATKRESAFQRDIA